MPQPTEQYVHMLRVTLAPVSLKCRTEASASSGAKPIIAMLEAPKPAAPERNCRRDTRTVIGISFHECSGTLVEGRLAAVGRGSDG